jgi:hypothetical protein
VPSRGIDGLERGSQRLELDDLGVAELPRDERRAILAEQENGGERGQRDDADEQEDQAPEERARPERHGLPGAVSAAGPGSPGGTYT